MRAIFTEKTSKIRTKTVFKKISFGQITSVFWIKTNEQMSGLENYVLSVLYVLKILIWNCKKNPDFIGFINS